MAEVVEELSVDAVNGLVESRSLQEFKDEVEVRLESALGFCL